MFNCLFFSIRVFFHRHWKFTGQEGKRGEHLLFNCTTSTRLWTFRHLQLCMWDDYHIFLIATLVFTRLLFSEIGDLIKLLFDWLMMQCLFICVLDDLIVGFSYQSTLSHTNTFIRNIFKILFASVSIVSYKSLCFL